MGCGCEEEEECSQDNFAREAVFLECMNTNLGDVSQPRLATREEPLRHIYEQTKKYGGIDEHRVRFLIPLTLFGQLSSMHLRKSITAPQRFEDHDFVDSRPSRVNRPTFPKLMADQVVPFNPNARPAVFPSLPFTSESNHSPNKIITSPAAHQFSEDWRNITSFGDVDQRNYAIKVDWHKSNDLINTDTSQPYNSLPNDLPRPANSTTCLPPCHQRVTASADKKAEGDGDGKHGPLNISVDDSSASSLGKNSEEISWSNLGLAMQLEIYINMLRSYTPAEVAHILCLRDDEFQAIDNEYTMSVAAPVVGIELHERVNREYMEGLSKYANPPSHSEILQKYLDEFIREGHLYHPYEYEIDRAREFLRQNDLDPSMAGVWDIDTGADGLSSGNYSAKFQG